MTGARHHDLALPITHDKYRRCRTASAARRLVTPIRGRDPDGWLRRESVSTVMSSYAKYCREQAAKCARRASMASSPEVVAHFRDLEARWLRFADKADGKGPDAGASRTAPASIGARAG